MIAKKERPILFSAPMVRAILAGHKTMTRRVVKPQPESRGVMGCARMLAFKKRRGPDYWLWPNAREQVLAMCPYGQPGDRLWVRETWAVQRHEPCLPHERDYQDLISPVIQYRADGATRRIQGDRATGVGVYHGAVEKTRVSIYMPRWASRLTLEITDVRVERLQDITSAQILAEGVRIPTDAATGHALIDISTPNGPSHFLKRSQYGDEDAVLFAHWAALWVQINGIESWNANPWVWVVEFKRLEQPHA